MLALQRIGPRLRGKVVPGLGRVGFLPLCAPAVAHPVLYESALSSLEHSMDPRLQAESRDRRELDGLRLVGLLEIARRGAVDWNNHGSWDPGQIGTEVASVWRDVDRPGTGDFRFDLIPNGDRMDPYRWVFAKGNHHLLVDVVAKR